MAFIPNLLSNLFSSSAVGAINDNLNKIKDSFSEVLRRDGSTTMLSNLDMDGRRIINHGIPRSGTDLATLDSVTGLVSTIAKGPSGPANSTFTSLVDLKNAPISNQSYILTTANGPLLYSYVLGDFTGKADDVNIVALNASPVTVGALVKQAASSLISLPAGAGVGYGLSLQDKIDQQVSHLDFGGKPDYAFSVGTGTDNAPAILRAANFLVNRYGGGRVIIMGRCRIGSNILLPKGVSLWAPAPPPDFLYAGLIAFWPHALYVDPTVTITLDSGTSVQNMLICRTGLKVNTTSTETASQFTGTPLVQKAGSVGVTVQSCMVLGFNRMFDCEDLTASYSYGRTTLAFNRFDCLNGPRLHNMGDYPLVLYNEGWPFLTTGSVAEANEAQQARGGIGFELTGYQGFTFFHGNFTYDYLIGLQINGTNPTAAAGSIRISNHATDGYPNAAPKGQIGINVLGNAFEITISDPLIQSQDTGLQVGTSNIYGIRAVRIVNPTFAEIKQNAVNVISGDVDVVDPQIRNVTINTPNGITNVGTGSVRVRDGIWTGHQTYAVARSSGSSGPLLLLGNPVFNSTFSNTIYLNPYKKTVTSAETLGFRGDEIEVYLSGATTIQSITNPSGFVGRSIVLVASSSLIIGGAGNIKTPGGTSAAIPINSRVTLSSDGTYFYLNV